MDRFIIAFRLNENSKAKGPKEHVKTFDDDKDATSFVAGIISSDTKDLVGITHYDFTSHDSKPYEPQLVQGRLKLVEK